jgi:hypothetical protein
MKHHMNRRKVSRIIQNGRSLYLLVPPDLQEVVGWKKGDAIALDTDGRTVFAARIPFEDLINRRALTRDGLIAETAS